MTKWKPHWGDREFSTAGAGERELGDAEGGQVERALRVSDNAICALARLVEVLHDKGLLTDDEVVRVLDLHGYDKVED
jgi:hypothetical protein